MKASSTAIQSELPTSNWSSTLTIESPRNPNIAFHRQSEFSAYPSAPFRPVIINFTDTEITVSWRKVQEIGSSPLIGYRLEYYDADSPKPTWLLASNRIFTEIFTLKHLQPNTRYVFAVRAENSHGLSAPSQLSNTVQTLKYAPNRLNPTSSSNQKDLNEIRSHLNGIQVILKDTKPMSANSVKLIWELVHRDQNVLVNKDNIEGYYIRFRDVGPDLDELQNDLKLLNKPNAAKMSNSEHQKYNMLTVLTSGSNVNSYVISDLSEFTLYELFVVPFYKSVDGPPSNSRLVRTLADQPSAPPAEVKAHLLNLTAISVHWKPVPKPQRNGIIQAYNIMLIPIQLANSTTAANRQASMNNLNSIHHHDLFTNHQNVQDNLPLPPPHYLDHHHHSILPYAIPQPPYIEQNSPIFPLPIEYQDNSNNNNDLTNAALLSRNALLFNSNGNFQPQQQQQQQQFQSNSPILLNQFSRNLTTNANTHQITIVGLQPGAIYQLRISAANMVGVGPASVPILLQMNSEYIIEGADREELDSANGHTNLEDATRKHTSLNRDLFNSKIITIVFTVSLAGLLIGAVCFVINRRSSNLNKFDKNTGGGSSILNKNKFSFTSTSNNKTNKLANDLFLNSNHPMISATDSLTSPTDALWIDRNWLTATQQNSQTTGDYPLLLKNDPTLLTGLNGRQSIEHRSTSSAIYASTSQLNCSSILNNANSNGGDYCVQNEYCEVSELGSPFANKLDSSQSQQLSYALNQIGSSKLSSKNSTSVLLPSNIYATTTLINLNQNNQAARVNLPDNNSVGFYFLLFK